MIDLGHKNIIDVVKYCKNKIIDDNCDRTWYNDKYPETCCVMWNDLKWFRQRNCMWWRKDYDWREADRIGETMQ